MSIQIKTESSKGIADFDLCDNGSAVEITNTTDWHLRKKFNKEEFTKLIDNLIKLRDEMNIAPQKVSDNEFISIWKGIFNDKT